ncbi:hypothetical protein EDB85DRAFT_1892774 [Lactarius pseudohatsudake]|nr:hypothetical protein EDB85DRAFT_1892774 [Lactarius pseudohatsudake]
MDSDAPFALPNISPEDFPPTDTTRQTSGTTVDAQASNATETRGIDLGVLDASQIQDRNDDELAPIPVDLADEVEGMYRLMDLISESGSNGYDSLRRFINAISPGAYATITKVDFKILDRLSIKPLGIYGCKDEIVRLLLSIGAVDEKSARLLLARDVGGSQRTLSSGLYIVTASAAGPADVHHYVIYWPQDSTWDDSATSYLTKMCDQVVALISADHSASIVWNDEDRDSISIDMDAGDSERLFTFEVTKTNEQEESAVSRPGFQVTPTFHVLWSVSDTAQTNSRAIMRNEAPLDCQADPSLFAPRLIPGETVQGLLTAIYIPPRIKIETFDQRSYSRVALSATLNSNALVLSEDLDEDSVQTLVDVALGDLHPEQCNEWLSSSQHIRDQFMQEKTKRKSAIARDIANAEDSLQRALREEVVDHVINLFPSLGRDGLFPPTQIHGASLEVESRNLARRFSPSGSLLLLDSVRLPDIRAQYPTFENIFEKYIKDARFDDVPRKGREFRALKLGLISLWQLQSEHKHLGRESRSALVQALVFGHDFQQAFQLIQKSPILRLDFLQHLESINDEDLRLAAQSAKALAQTELSSSIDAVVKKITHAVQAMQQDLRGREVQLQVEDEEREELKGALVEFVREINKKSVQGQDSTIFLDRIEMRRERRRLDYRVSGRWEMPKMHQVPQIELRVHPMDLTSDDRHNMQLDPKHVPTPTINDRLTSSFRLSTLMEPTFYQLLENEKILLVLANRDKFLVYLERLPVLDRAIQRGKPIKSLNRDKLGRGVLFAFDETKRTLAVCASTKLQLHMFVFDETFRTLQGQGSAIDLAPWYSQADISILKMSFVCGSEEVALVDSIARVRIFSFVTLQFSRGRVFFLGLDINAQAVKSVAIDITKKVTEFMFKEKGHKLYSTVTAEVWTRFPVLPAVKRRTITSLSERQQKTLTFITENDTRPFASYFSDLVQTFEKTTRKPTGDELSGIKVSAAQYEPFWDNVLSASDWDVSRYRVGEWLVDLLCLIPIHIAVCRENRFVPLANGVLSAELERSLLGAEVNQIVDKLSFGWYESIFQSYLALKPVKVVSSMGQQSVGKSFSLNHLVDTSFAGSAMRTTEGVWMSVTPTDEALIVALDFEGVDSIERSPQEDTLLVLFNTAISNLVLFRNNFAFSRDISGLFQSFQSSASVLDPAVNPTLFQSTLVIIIKDVVEADTVEITREFSLKFQQIVQQEQDANFISRLHGGKLDIIPWPVIESRNFYKLFATLKKRLDLQKISHPAAGEFLYTIKTLMAKLKANDWGALSRSSSLLLCLPALFTLPTDTMAEHRAKSLAVLLPIALATGYSEIDPEPEPLKNFDSDLTVECDDTEARFAIFDREQPPSDEIGMYLAALLESQDPGTPRQLMPDSEWVGELASHLGWLVDLRVNHVKRWLDSNLESFAELNARHAISSAFVVGYMRATIAVKPTHKCIHDCEFCEDSEKLCGSAVAPDIRESTSVSSTLTCVATLVNYREGEAVYKIAPRLWDMPKKTDHICSALVHTCGEPCALRNVELPGGKTPICPGSCSIPRRVTDVVSRSTREAHSCAEPCAAPGICQIDTSPQSIEATFTGRHETFQYTKYTQGKDLAHKPWKLTHTFSVSYYQGHTQQEHETSHGSMTETHWAVDGPDGASLELGGRKFSSNDEGAPMMCNLVCSSMGRHVHIDYCRADQNGPCDSVGIQHINDRMLPDPDKPKDAVVHSLYWRRTDPYTRDERVNFGKCDAMCSGSEHLVTASETAHGPPQPSYCTLPMFHRPKSTDDPMDGVGYISDDGHMFSCKNPAVVQQTFHVIFVIDRSSSMSNIDRRPLDNAPATDRIRERVDNRLGAVYSALYSFWSARHTAVATDQQTIGVRRDAYSVILFNATTKNVVVNDFTSSPDQLLDIVLNEQTEWGTNFAVALQAGQEVMADNWSTERTPIMIFLSDGECPLPETEIQDLCRSAIQHGWVVYPSYANGSLTGPIRKPLSFHAVAFGPNGRSYPTLRMMTQLALEIQRKAPPDPLFPVAARIPSSFTSALDTRAQAPWARSGVRSGSCQAVVLGVRDLLDAAELEARKGSAGSGTFDNQLSRKLRASRCHGASAKCATQICGV